MRLDQDRRARQLTYRDVSAIFGTYSEEGVRQHWLRDSGNPFFIARLVEFFYAPPAPTPPSEWFSRGLIAEKFMEMADERGWGYKDITTLSLSYWKLKTDNEKALTERIRKFYEEQSTNAYLTALQAPLFGFKTFHPRMFLKSTEIKEKKPKQLYLALGQ